VQPPGLFPLVEATHGLRAGDQHGAVGHLLARVGDQPALRLVGLHSLLCQPFRQPVGRAQLVITEANHAPQHLRGVSHRAVLQNPVADGRADAFLGGRGDTGDHLGAVVGQPAFHVWVFHQQ
jgi:hypothetical protein